MKVPAPGYKQTSRDVRGTFEEAHEAVRVQTHCYSPALGQI
jgi:hypothetical protein